MSDWGRDIAKYVIYFLLGIIFTMTWITARDAQGGVNGHSTKIAVIEMQMKIVEEIRQDVKKLLQQHGPVN